jgi:site-specific recombinase XerD
MMFSCYRGACLPRSNPKENALIEKYFSAPKTLRRLRTGLSGPHIDGFAEALEHRGYSHATAIRYLRAAAHLGCFLLRKDAAFADINAAILEDFRRHLSRCRCPQSNGGRTGHHAQFGVKLFHQHLMQCGVCPSPSVSTEELNPVPPVVAAFQTWFQTHRGVAQPTLRLYARGARELIGALGEDVRAWTPQLLRAFLLDRANQCGAETTQKLITSLRAFLRYLSFRGEARPDLDLAIPAIAHWRLASLPPCLSAEELQLLIKACDGNTPARLRDRAIVLLLSTLVHGVFRKLLKSADLMPERGPVPRLHELRHTLAVRALEASPGGRQRIGQHMLALATYLGHVNINTTYWYLESTAELLCDIASAGEKFLSGGRS